MNLEDMKAIRQLVNHETMCHSETISRKTYEKLRREAEGIWDSLFEKSCPDHRFESFAGVIKQCPTCKHRKI